ncbi:predicted protein [Phaeodactylum tricornutum CCAP 1055/1]|uniref:Uncharacterized protein n=1 Tax=Phaeodactylum tricornutum (strain CCAP 1055/1) TaxID=556484 RepID=B7FYZ8_PHATC|nr:predicted protein [Phaeodactylum tricornutum CCAP 1055/1]EEC48447.1 predicted protein [Phaeodactylum tricornutum CCAP 1055/1]|eukprot:XP_002180256.1 predicted protein [Phaeodactylum tricornutum CCAP 1055/1]
METSHSGYENRESYQERQAIGNESDVSVVAKLVLLRLSPILRKLLDLLKTLEELDRPRSLQITQDGFAHHEQFLFLLQNQIEVLKHLRRGLELLKEDFSPSQISTSLLIIFDFASLPLLLILRSDRHSWVLQTNDDSARIRQSATWTRLRGAAFTLTVLIGLVRAPDVKDDSTSRLSVSKALVCIEACAMAIPSGQEIVGLQSDSTQSTGLDRGEDCLQALFECMKVLVGGKGHEDTGLKHAISESLEGALMARVTDSCIACCGNSSRTIGISEDREWSDFVRTGCLEVLRTWIEVIDIPEPWQRLFPGLFSGIVRTLLSSLRKGQTSDLTVRLFKLLGELLTRCLPGMDHQQPFEATSAPDWQALVKLAQRTKDPSLVVSSKINHECEFRVQCRKRIASPLAALIQMTCVVRSRFAVHSDPELAAAAGDVLNVYLKKQSATPLRESFWVYRTISLMEELQVMAQSRREIELQAKARLANGYLSWIGKSKATANRLRASLSVSETVNHRTQIFGPKEIATLVDGWLGKLFQLCAKRVKRKESLMSREHSDWLHEWIGVVLLATRLVDGAFRMSENDSKNIKRKRLLSKLSTSVLPVLTSTPLWDLPTATLKATAYTNDAGSKAIAVALRGNIAMSCSLLQMVASLFHLLSKDGREIIPLALYPLLEKIGFRQAFQVHDTAVFTLHTAASTCEYFDVNEMLQDNMETVLGATMGRLRLAQTSLATGIEQDTVLQVVASTTALLRIASCSRREKVESPEMPSRNGYSILSFMEELVLRLLQFFDRASSLLRFDESATLVFVDLFEAALLQLNAWYGTNMDVSGNGEDVIDSGCETWMNALKPFEKIEKFLPNENGIHLPSEETLARAPLLKDKLPDVPLQAFVSIKDTDFASSILSRCAYLLAHPCLAVQIRSCTIVSKGFSFLGWVSRHASYSEEEPNGARTAILRQIASLWPVVAARLKVTSADLNNRSSNASSLLLVSKTESVNSSDHKLGEKRIFLSELLELTATMTVSTDDFMASRFRENAWPCIVSVLEKLIKLSPESSSRRSIGKQIECQAHLIPLPESERILIKAALGCLSRVFGHGPNRSVLIDLGQSCATIVFPLLESYDPDFVELTVDVVKALLRIDCDTIWRSLWDMTGRPIPDCPLNRNKRSLAVAQNLETATPLAVKASELLDYIESLPEQSLI